MQDASRRTGILAKGGVRKGGVRCGMDTSHLPSPPSLPGSTAPAESHPATRSRLAVPVGVYLVLGFQTSLLISLYFPRPKASSKSESNCTEPRDENRLFKRVLPKPAAAVQPMQTTQTTVSPPRAAPSHTRSVELFPAVLTVDPGESPPLKGYRG